MTYNFHHVTHKQVKAHDASPPSTSTPTSANQTNTQNTAKAVNEVINPGSKSRTVVPSTKPSSHSHTHTAPKTDLPRIKKLSLEKLEELSETKIKKIEYNQNTANPKDVKWLQKKKRFAQQEIKKLKILKEKNIENKDNLANQEFGVDNVSSRIDGIVINYERLINNIDIKIKKAPYLLVVTKHNDNLFGTISRCISNCVEKIFALIQSPPPLLQEINTLVGEHRKISNAEFQILEKLLKNPKFKDGYNCLVDDKSLKIEDSSVFLEKWLEKWIDKLSTIRAEQLELIDSGSNVMPVTHNEISTLLKINSWFNSAIDLLKDEIGLSEDELNALKLFSQSITESACYRNSQAISDNLYPACVLSEADSKGTESRAINAQRIANEKEGMTKGFISLGLNLHYKSDWENIETRGDDNIFVQGYRRIVFQTPDGHQVEAGALFDLSPLGDLSKEQVFKIFTLTGDLLAGNFHLIEKKPTTEFISVDLNQDGDNIHELDDRLKDGKTLQMNEEQMPKLREIILDFCHKMTNAFTLALISVGHEQP